MRKLISLMALGLTGLLTATTALAQGLSVNTTGSAADASAMLDVSATTQGVLVPRMDSAHIAAISSPATGLLVFQTNGVTPGFYYYTGSGWSRVGATPLPQYYGIVASSGANGSVSPYGTSIVTSGSTRVYSITPTLGSFVSTVTVDGSSVGAVNTYTFSAVSANHNINATFGVSTYSLVASSGANGSISPSGTTVVSYGGSQVYSVTPSMGYSVNNVTVDGSGVGSVGTYTFSPVTANHTISATFNINSDTIVATSGANGTISPVGTTTVTSGASQTYTITPTSGYAINSLTVDGVSVAVARTYSFAAVNATHTIAATFALPAIGVYYQGGIIVYILQPGDPGYNASTTHGLIAAPSDQSNFATSWGCYTTTGATGTALGTGASNSNRIFTLCPIFGTAAYLCLAYHGDGYADWYLPSKDELNTLYINQGVLSNVSDGIPYWSSSESASNLAWLQIINNPYLFQDVVPKAHPALVRAVRSF